MNATRQIRGKVGHLSGLAAEDGVLRTYLDRGYVLAESRFRGPGGEIDLIFRDGDGLIFVEVKKSATHASAALRVSARQAARIQTSACAYLDRMPKGQLTDMRFDVALVDAQGRIEVLENAFS